MSLSERLVMIREQNGYTRKRLADELGKPYTTITKYENGQREPGHDYLLLIAKKFGVTVDYILGIDPEQNQSNDVADYLEDLRTRPETRALLEATKGMTKEQVEAMAEFAKTLRGG